ncbi:MAG: DsrE family protein [Anaerolineae bacterium]|nr:DsrE family protein [Anaerolineae bacterium]
MSEPTKLLVIWSAADKEVALHNVFMYTHNAKKQGWWEEVRLLIWGPSDKLLAEDEELQKRVRAMQADGIDVIACKACADIYGVSDALEELGVNVFYVGQALTEMLKEGWVTLTY